MHTSGTDERQAEILEWRYPKLAKAESDSGFCYIIQRRISCYFSIFFARLGLKPAGATMIDFLFGCLAALAIVFQYYLLGILLICLFSIWSCVDGEIARLSKRSSRTGDFFDTLTDRSIELVVVIALFSSVHAVDRQVNSYLSLIFLCYLGGVYLLTVSSEKYRSTMHRNYPKRKTEPLFSWISAGSDIRLFWISVVLATLSITNNQSAMMAQMGVLATLFFLNLAVRMIKVKRLLRPKEADVTSSAPSILGGFPGASIVSSPPVRQSIPQELSLVPDKRPTDAVSTEHQIH